MTAFRIINRDRIKAQFQWEPRDLWVGLFWRRTDIALHLYICIVPLVPLHITILWASCTCHGDPTVDCPFCGSGERLP